MHKSRQEDGAVIDAPKLKIALDRVALGLTSANKQMRPKTVADGGKAMSYALSLSLGAIEMPDDRPLELAWDHWARRNDETGAEALALAVLAQLIPEPIREDEASLLGQIALWLDMVVYDDPSQPDSDALAARVSSPESDMAEAVAAQALEDLDSARDALRTCLLENEDSSICEPNKEAVAAAERQLDAASELVLGHL